MMFFVCILVGILLGIYKNYSSSSKEKFIINKKYILYILLFSQILFRISLIITNLINLLIFSLISGVILCIIFLIYNIRNLSIVFISLGYILNCIVMLFNNGRMPVLIKEKILDIRHININSDTKLYWLSDIIHLPCPLDYGSYLVSIGDIVISIGILLLSYNLMTKDIND